MQESKKPIIQSIRDYVMLNPDIDDRKINIDYLGNGMEYSIDPIGADPVYKRYTDGTCLKQFQFAFTSKEAYDGDARTGIANSGFYQAFEEWVESNNMNDILPELDGHDATRVDVLQSGYTWRGRMEMKVIEPPSGSDYKTVSGELNAVLKKLIEPEFGGLYVVSGESTGVTVSNYQFDRYCTLLEGITKMLKTVGYRLDIQHKRERGVPGYILIRAVPIVDYSDEIELSKDSGLNYTMEDKRNGVNHLIVTGKGELKDRNVLHLYVWPNGSFKRTQYYKGLAEITQVYENTSTETDELESQSTKKLQELCSKKIFGMDIAKLGINVGIGDIVGGRDYLTGMYSSRPIANIIYSVTNRVESKEYELEGESDNGNS